MLEFREIDYETDIEEIIILIKKGLDKNYTEEFFKWKHIDNPFGKSYGLLAIDNGTIIGLRMFMFWEFKKKDDKHLIRAIRPVDTVVHIDYRGKGLFKKLTLKGLEACNGKYDLIFNTPNENSLPGYLKMGWEKAKSCNFKIGLIFPSISKFNISFGSYNCIDFYQCDNWSTVKSKAYFDWRYCNSDYKITSYKNASIIYNIAKKKFQNQIIIQEAVGNSYDIKTLFKQIAKIEKSILFYYYADQNIDKIFKWNNVRKKSVVVFRDDSLNIGNSIDFSLGDLEGKL